MMTPEAKPWKEKILPRRILVIRLQAMGDVVITLPYLQHLRNALPSDTVIDFVTREETKSVADALLLFNDVYAIRGGRNFKWQLLHTLMLLPRLSLRSYDVVIDLQNNVLSRIIRKAVAAKAWTTFDRFSPKAAGERNRITIEAAGLGANKADHSFQLKPLPDVTQLLRKNGWKGDSPLVIINPAGAFENRNWPIENYVRFAELWLAHYPTAQFVIMGIDRVAGKATFLKDSLGDYPINLVNQTTPATAFSIVQRASFVLSEDSGLMHMAWVSGVPTLAMFGSTRSDWSRPLGPHTDFVDSSDLACGNCMLEACYLKGEQHNVCMTRWKPELIFERALKLMRQSAALSETVV